MKRFLFLALVVWVTAGPSEARAQFDLGRQLTSIANQVTGVLNQVNQYAAAVNEYIHLDCAAQGMTPTASATPAIASSVVCGSLNALGAFQGAYRDLANIPNTVGNILPATDWRTVLAQADTVSEADIRTIYAGQPAVVAGAVAAFNARREAADRQVVMSHERANAAEELAAALDAAEVAVNDMEARSPVTATALGQTKAALTLARTELVAAFARHKAHEAALDALATQAEELGRRELEAEHQRVRTRLGASWAQERAELDANRAQRMDSLYGGYALHPLFGGTP